MLTKYGFNIRNGLQLLNEVKLLQLRADADAIITLIHSSVYIC